MINPFLEYSSRRRFILSFHRHPPNVYCGFQPTNQRRTIRACFSLEIIRDIALTPPLSRHPGAASTSPQKKTLVHGLINKPRANVAYLIHWNYLPILYYAIIIYLWNPKNMIIDSLLSKSRVAWFTGS